MTISRALKEEVPFDRAAVTSLDWSSYPILQFSEVPEAIALELIDQPVEPDPSAAAPMPLVALDIPQVGDMVCALACTCRAEERVAAMHDRKILRASPAGIPGMTWRRIRPRRGVCPM